MENRFSVFVSLWVSFGVSLFYYMYILLCSDRLSSHPDLSFDIPVFDTLLYIYNLALAYPLLVALSIGVLRFRVAIFLFTPFSTKAPSYNPYSHYYTY